MTNPALKAAYDKLLELPEERQEKAAELIEDFLAGLAGPWREEDLQLSPEQIEEVRRRMADPNPEFVPHDEMKVFLDRLTRED